MMKIYLASRYSRLEELNRYKAALENLGHKVTSRWLNGSHQAPDNAPANDDHAQRFALEDVHDVIEAEVLIHFTEEPRTASRGGRHFEAGLALGAGKEVIVVGPLENVFYFLPQIERYENFTALLDRLTIERAVELGVPVEVETVDMADFAAPASKSKGGADAIKGR